MKVAGVTGLEPAASGVTGRRSNQLSYTPPSPAAIAAREILKACTGWDSPSQGKDPSVSNRVRGNPSALWYPPRR